MLTSNSIARALKNASSYGETGKHVHGRGSQRTDGTFSDESPRKTRETSNTDEKPKE